MQLRGYQKWINGLMMVGGVILLLGFNGPVTLAYVGLEPTPRLQLSESGVVDQAQAEPPLQSAADTTVFLPAVMRSPAVTTGCDPTEGSGGLAPGTHATTVAGLKATVIVGQGYNPAETTYFAFYIHGNDGDIDRFKSSSNPVNKFINQHGWVFVAPHSPQGNSWSTPWDESLNEAFANVLDEMFAKYNICRRTVIGATVSGGSVFWTRRFFPLRGGEYQAHTSIVCGAWAVPNSSQPLLTQLGRNPEVVANSTFDYIYGPLDYLAPNIEDSIAEYTAAGFKVEQLVIEGGKHCDQWLGQGLPSSSQRIADDWEDRIQELNLQ